MQLTTMGLVIKVVKTGEADRIVHILTPKFGVISAIAKSGQRLKSKLFSSTGLFCYAEFTLFEGKNMYVIDEAEVSEVFFGMRQSIEGMATAMYFAEIVSTLLPTGNEAAILLRLLLNSLYYISEQKRDLKQLKAIFELRCLTIVGYMPNLIACDNCIKYEGGAFYFDTIAGTLLCADCALARGIDANIDAGTLAAMRHIVFSEDEKVFAFTVSNKSLLQLQNVAVQYFCNCIDKPLRSLDFLNTLI
ncbi:MAG: DNA repair protein RecO [Oscillospiraceae bacterium]